MKKYQFDYLCSFHVFLTIVSFLPAFIILLFSGIEIDFADNWFGILKCAILAVILFFAISFVFSLMHKDKFIINNDTLSVTMQNKTQTVQLSDITYIEFFPGLNGHKTSVGRTRGLLSKLILFNNDCKIMEIENASIFMLIGLIKQTHAKFKISNKMTYVFYALAWVAFVILAIIMFKYLA